MDSSINRDQLLDMTPVYPAVDVVQQLIDEEKRSASKKVQSNIGHSSKSQTISKTKITSGPVTTRSTIGSSSFKALSATTPSPSEKNTPPPVGPKLTGNVSEPVKSESSEKSPAKPIPSSSYTRVNNSNVTDPAPEKDEEESYEKVLWSYSTMTSAIKLSSTPDIDSTMAKLTSNQDRSISSKRLSQTAAIVSNQAQTSAMAVTSARDYNQGSKPAHVTSNRTIYLDSRGRQQQSEYEIVPKSAILDVYSSDPEVERFLHQLPRICAEHGYNQQDYKCYSCRRPIGMIYGPSRVCNYDGHLYCVECHINEESVIPARILCNWDFQRYPVSKRNQNFLSLISTEPLFDLKILAPMLYSVYPEVRKVLDLRSQAFFLRSYCFTCTQDTISFELTKLVWPREHLIEHIHLYSLEDLEQVKNGAMATLLRKVIAFARKHVLSCLLCSQKGFICELCKSPQILYPFDTDSIYRCDKCQSVFHLLCFSSLPSFESCPRCNRLKGRQSKVGVESPRESGDAWR